MAVPSAFPSPRSLAELGYPTHLAQRVRAPGTDPSAAGDTIEPNVDLTPGVGRAIPAAPGVTLPLPRVGPRPLGTAAPQTLSFELRSSLEALQRENPEAYQQALDQIAADFFATTEDRVGFVRALLESTAGPSQVASDIYDRIGPQEGGPEGRVLTSAELAEVGLRLLTDTTEVVPSRPALESLPRAALRDIAAALRQRALEPNAEQATVNAAVTFGAALLRARAVPEVAEAEQESLAHDMRFAFGPSDDRTLDPTGANAVDLATPRELRAELQALMVTRIEAMLAGEPSVETLASVHAALAACGGKAVDPQIDARLQELALRAKPPTGPSLVAPAADGITVRETAEVPLPWLADGLAVLRNSNAETMAAALIADTPSLPAPQARAFQRRLQQAIEENIARGDQASRAITLDVVDEHGDRRAFTYDLQRYRNPNNSSRSSDPHLHASGIRFASEAGRARLEAIRTRRDAELYADEVINNVQRDRATDRQTALTTAQKRAIRDGIIGWFNLAVHHGMPVNPVLRVIDDSQRTTSLNRAININLESGREQQFWSGGRRARLVGLTSSTRNGDRNGDGVMDWYSNKLDRKAFELGHFNLHLYRGRHGRTLQHDGVNPRFQSQWNPQLSATHTASYVRIGPPVVSGRSNMCDAVADTAASRAMIVDLDGGQIFRHSSSHDSAVANRWSLGVRRQDYTGRIWQTNDPTLRWGPIPDYTPVPSSIYPDLVRDAL